MKFALSTLPAYKFLCDFAIITYNDKKTLELPMLIGTDVFWGEAIAYKHIEDEVKSITNIEVGWRCTDDDILYCFELRTQLDVLGKINNLLGEDGVAIIIGLAPLGYIAFWSKNKGEQILLSAFKTVPSPEGNSVIKETNICSERNYYDFKVIFKQYYYRLCVFIGNDETVEYKGLIRFKGFDGCKHMLQSFDICKSHSIPEKISVKYNVLKTEFEIFSWINLNEMHLVFERFYGAHPETKADFIIRIDVEKKKYELALYRQGLKEPVVIPESAYQLIVFKNKFEDYRSENYNQPRGAWIW